MTVGISSSTSPGWRARTPSSKRDDVGAGEQQRRPRCAAPRRDGSSAPSPDRPGCSRRAGPRSRCAGSIQIAGRPKAGSRVSMPASARARRRRADREHPVRTELGRARGGRRTGRFRRRAAPSWAPSWNSTGGMAKPLSFLLLRARSAAIRSPSSGFMPCQAALELAAEQHLDRRPARRRAVAPPRSRLRRLRRLRRRARRRRAAAQAASEISGEDRDRPFRHAGQRQQDAASVAEHDQQDLREGGELAEHLGARAGGRPTSG